MTVAAVPSSNGRMEEIELAKARDQFYTKDATARVCYQLLQTFLTDKQIVPKHYLEPSAGGGAFYKLLPINARLGFDLEPQCEGVVEADFLKQALTGTDWITVGNPPFGKNSSLAVKFFNHAAGFSQVIAMIFPRTFMKSSLQHRLDSRFHLEYEEVLPLDSFSLLGEDYAVPCAFQIWQRRAEVRCQDKSALTHIDFDFVTREQGDFAIQRVGVNAGVVKDISERLASPSHYFIRGGKTIRARFEKMWREGRYHGVKYNTAGNPSISKRELVRLWESIEW